MSLTLCACQQNVVAAEELQGILNGDLETTKSKPHRHSFSHISISDYKIVRLVSTIQFETYK